MSPKTRPLFAETLAWGTVAAFRATVTRGDDRGLMLLVQPNGDTWGVIALETSARANATDVLADHAHQVVGTYASIVDAFGAAESFAASWCKDFKSTRAKPCDCPAIGADEMERRIEAGKRR